MAPFGGNCGSKFWFLGDLGATFKKNPATIGRKCVGHTRAREKTKPNHNQRKNAKAKKQKKKNTEQYLYSYPASYPYPYPYVCVAVCLGPQSPVVSFGAWKSYGAIWGKLWIKILVFR